tara:strand:- start:20 stop:199 length:180 start_codon:yes stop_codon:yes gene_type:complete
MLVEVERTPLLMLPNGNFVRTTQVPEGATVVPEPPVYEFLPKVEDQTAAVLGTTDRRQP